MLERIVKKINGISFSIFKKKLSDIQKASKLSNVSIHKQNSISFDTVIYITSKAKKLFIGSDVGCRRFCNFLVYPNATLIINNGVYFNNYCSINCLGYIEIGENTLFGEGVKIYDHNHKYYYQNEKLIVEKADFTIGKIVIGKNCWIGSNVSILNNVVIGDNVIIGANCLIYKSLPSNTVVKHAEELIINQYKTF